MNTRGCDCCTRTTTTHRKQRRRRRRTGPLLFILPRLSSATTNFCGTSWDDASADCANRQPCPKGTDEECEIGTCWADTSCDTSKGDGVLYDIESPQHLRFCGKSWNDANDNCEISRHCPTGKPSECPSGEECFSFLDDCNYVDMVRAPSDGSESASSSDGDADGGGSVVRLPSSDPRRSNYCGHDWNDVLANCGNDDHWCPSGSDADCAVGKICYADTECYYSADLIPTETPTVELTDEPTPSPAIYDAVENTRFCGEGWEDVAETCQIGTHCPSGSNIECPGSQVCFSWVQGCNILDLEEHLRETGQEIYGVNHLPLLDDGLGIANVGDEPPQLPPSEMAMPMRTQPPTRYDPNRYKPENHIFCGKSYSDASERCDIETFCSDGITCANAGDFCWVGIDACDAADWVPTIRPSGKPTTPAPSTTPSVSPGKPSQVETSTLSSTRQSYCATDYTDLMLNCANKLPKCDRLTPCPDGLMCFANVECTVKEDSESTSPDTTEPTFSPILPPNRPTDSPTVPITHQPTEYPTILTLSEAEVAQRLTNMNSYCATSYAEVISSCSHSLHTCNLGESICPVGTFCFESIVCPDSDITKTPVAESSESTPPTTLSPILESGDANTAVPQNYCAKNEDEIQVTCSTAPTCNADDEPCPLGYFCYGNHVCNTPSAIVTQVVTAAPTIPPTNEPTLAPVASPSAPPTLKPTPRPTVDANRNTVMQNYCAQNVEMLGLTCAWAPTCNAGDAACPVDTACFFNVICDSITQTADFAVQKAPSPTALPTPEQSSSESVATTGNPSAKQGLLGGDNEVIPAIDTTANNTVNQMNDSSISHFGFEDNETATVIGQSTDSSTRNDNPEKDTFYWVDNSTNYDWTRWSSASIGWKKHSVALAFSLIAFSHLWL